MNNRADIYETGKRAKPLRTCKRCGCGIRAVSYCGPCADEARDEQRRRYLASRKARKAEEGVRA